MGDFGGRGVEVEVPEGGSVCKEKEKVIIDTDPGIDDSMTILMAFQSPELDILGLTTVFGNAYTEISTRNALLLCEIAGRPDAPVAEGNHEPLKGGIPRSADFIHGSDGLGNIFLPPPVGNKIEKSASEFLVEKVTEYPSEVSILALGPLTNLALAIRRDSSFASKVKKIVILGGAFFSSGNVNPAAEANVKHGEFTKLYLHFAKMPSISGDISGLEIKSMVASKLRAGENRITSGIMPNFSSKFKAIVVVGEYHQPNVSGHFLVIYGDPEAADVVFTCGADIVVVGINITTQVKFTDMDLEQIKCSNGRYAELICQMCKFYRDWHVNSDGVNGIFLHDPVSFAALVRPDFFTFKKGVVRVETQGICIGHTLMDQGLKKWNSSNTWSGYKPISVAWTVDVPGVLDFIKVMLTKM